MKDASRSVPVVAALLSDEQRPKLLADDRRPTTTSLRERHAARRTPRDAAADRRRPGPTAPPIDWTGYRPPRPRMLAAAGDGRAAPAPGCDHVHHAATQFVQDLPRLPAGRAARLHRLAAVLQRLGDEGPVPRHPQQPGDAARPRAGSTRTRRRCSTRSSTEKWLRASGVFGLFPANTVDGDDIEVYTDESRSDRADDAAPAAPADRGPRRRRRASRWPTSSRRRRPGCATTSARSRSPPASGSPSKVAEFKEANDDYSAILLESLADRLAEAFAERLHERVRTEFWGYAPDEHLDNDGADRREVRRHPAGAGLPGLPGAHREADASGSCSTSRRTPASSSPRAWPCGRAPRSAGCTSRTRSRSTSSSAGSAATRSRTTPQRKGWTVAEAERWLSPEPGLPHRGRVTAARGQHLWASGGVPGAGSAIAGGHIGTDD